MMADMTQDRRVTDLVQGPNHPAFSDGSRLLSALPSPVHEELGSGPSRPTGYKVMRIFPQSPLTAESRIMSAQSVRCPSPRPSKLRAVLAAVKAWPGDAEPAAPVQRRPALTAAARGAPPQSRSGRRNASVKQRNIRPLHREVRDNAPTLPLDPRPHTRTRLMA